MTLIRSSESRVQAVYFVVPSKPDFYLCLLFYLYKNILAATVWRFFLNALMLYLAQPLLCARLFCWFCL